MGNSRMIFNQKVGGAAGDRVGNLPRIAHSG
jgi:hypothetical protein